MFGPYDHFDSRTVNKIALFTWTVILGALLVIGVPALTALVGATVTVGLGQLGRLLP